MEDESRLRFGDFSVKKTERSAKSLRLPDNASHSKILQGQKGSRTQTHELIDKIRICGDGRIVIRRLGVLTRQRRVVFDDVVFGETIEVDSSTVPTEKNASESQEISQRFCEMVYTMHRLDQGVYREVPAVTITGTGYLS